MSNNVKAEVSVSIVMFVVAMVLLFINIYRKRRTLRLWNKQRHAKFMTISIFASIATLIIHISGTIFVGSTMVERGVSEETVKNSKEPILAMKMFILRGLSTIMGFLFMGPTVFPSLYRYEKVCAVPRYSKSYYGCRILMGMAIGSFITWTFASLPRFAYKELPPILPMLITISLGVGLICIAMVEVYCNVLLVIKVITSLQQVLGGMKEKKAHVDNIKLRSAKRLKWKILVCFFGMVVIDAGVSLYGYLVKFAMVGVAAFISTLVIHCMASFEILDYAYNAMQIIKEFNESSRDPMSDLLVESLDT